MSMKEEHQVTIQSRQHEPLGAELEPIDPSYLGKAVQVTKTKGGSLPKYESEAIGHGLGMDEKQHKHNSHDHNHSHKH